MKKNNIQSRQDAIKELVTLGACQYMKDLELYHGRANVDGKRFTVKNLDNGANKTGNMNVSNMRGLYTAELGVAQDFAKQRALEKGGEAEVHRIVGINDDDVIFNISFDFSSLSEQDKKRYRDAIFVLTNFAVTNALPLNFDKKEIYQDIIFPTLQENGGFLIEYNSEKSVLDKIKSKLNDKRQEILKTGQISKLGKYQISESELEKLALDYIYARNTKFLLRLYPTKTLYDSIYGRYVRFVNPNARNFQEMYKEIYSISPSYLSAWFANNHIAGLKFPVLSATLRKRIDTYHLTNIPQIMTERDYGEYLQEMTRLEEIGRKRFSNVLSQDVELFFRSASGGELVEYVSQDKTCKELYDKSAKLWEGWTVGQHTASVIDFFNQYYADSLPDNMHAIMKLTFLAHDIGKGVTKLGESHQDASLRLSDQLFDSLNIENDGVDVRAIVKFIIGKGQQYTTQILLKESEEEKDRKIARHELTQAHRYDQEKILVSAFNQDCRNVLKQSFGTSPTKEEVDALRNMCLILQFCDSGAYTYYAKIKEGKTYVSGGNERFTKSFEKTNKGTPILKKAEKLGLVLTTNERLNVNMQNAREQDIFYMDETTNPLRVI